MKHLLQYLSFLTTALAVPSTSSPSVLHYTVHRRDGAFPTPRIANLTFLAEAVVAAEARFNLTRREMNGNKVVRKAKEDGVGGAEHARLMADVGRHGGWFAKLKIGQPEQTVEMDLDMLTSDFFLVSTTSGKGSQFFDFHSQSYQASDRHPFPRCRVPSDLCHLPTIHTAVPLSFAHCRPAKASLDTLQASGYSLGLAPAKSLRQMQAPSFLEQLVEQKAVQRSIWSMMLINGHEGVFSIGGTGAEAVRRVEKQTKAELARAGLSTNTGMNTGTAMGPAPAAEDNEANVDEEDAMMKIQRTSESKGSKPRDREWEDAWKWSKVQGAKGWWQVLMQGIWVDGSKVLRNQAVILDINTPFILAPPAATKILYSSISGSRQLAAPFDQFYAFPCLNPPHLAFEFGGWPFPTMAGGADDWERLGTKFSLGKVSDRGGYCVGAVVETRMGVGGREKTDRMRSRGSKRKDGEGGGDASSEGEGWAGLLPFTSTPYSSSSSSGTMDAGNGLRDVWVLGEVFFRGVSAVFDVNEEKVGFRSY